VEAGEPLELAVMREAKEETSLSDLPSSNTLSSRRWMSVCGGKDELHVRHFFHLEPGPHTFPGGVVPDRWIHYEYEPSDGSPAPIEFEFFGSSGIASRLTASWWS
jgi:8-oxo-dGTP pyrophosphatase MutT (NUDIX family)